MAPLKSKQGGCQLARKWEFISLEGTQQVRQGSGQGRHPLVSGPESSDHPGSGLGEDV